MKQRLRSICMVLAFIIGGLFHSELHFLAPCLPYSIAVMLTITFMGVKPSRMRFCRKQAEVLLLLPLMAVAVWFAVNRAGYPLLAESLFFCAGAPIAAASPIIVNLLKGNVEFATVLMVASHAVFAVLMPLMLPIVVDNAEVGYAELAGVVALQIVTVLGPPTLIALVMRRVYPACRTWVPKLRDVSLGIWVFNLVVVTAIGMERLTQGHIDVMVLLPILVGAAILCVCSFVLGYRLGAPDLKRECSQSLGQKNTILSLYIATQGYASPMAYLGPVMYIFCHNIANAVQISLAQREEKRRAH